MSGSLHIVSTPIGNLEDITLRAIDTLSSVDLILAEDTRHSQILLSHYQVQTKVISFHEHNEKNKIEKIIFELEKGMNIALISDAGTPLINDPGYSLVRLAKERNINVIPVPGPSAPIAALSASGLSSDAFIYLGFVPLKESDRIDCFNRLKRQKETTIFFESPKRVLNTFKELRNFLGKFRRVSLSKEISKRYETIITNSIEEIINFLEDKPEHQKGEFVILIEGNKEVDMNEQKELLSKIMPHLLEELSPSKAAKVAAKITKLNKDFCYREITNK